MQHCTQCGCAADFDELVCRACGYSIEHEAVDRDPRRKMTAVARFSSAAEAGFFAHELSRESAVSVELTVQEHFDAISGFWTTRYVLLSPEDDAALAADKVQELLQQTEGDDVRPHGAATSASEAPAPMPGGDGGSLSWFPIVLTLAAGTAAIGLARKWKEPKPAALNAPAPKQDATLWEHMESESGPWRQQLGARGVRELRFLPRNVAVIRDDADGDGVFERSVRVQRTER